MSTWKEWSNDNISRGLCRSCTRPARIDQNGRTMVYCVVHAMRENLRKMAKKGRPSRKHTCILCGGEGHDRRTHALHFPEESLEAAE